MWEKRGVSNDSSRWAPPDADSSPAPGAEPTTQSTAAQPQGSAAGNSGVASSLKPVLGSLVSKSTGIQAEGPWEDDQPMALVDDVLVTCSGYETCSGGHIPPVRGSACGRPSRGFNRITPKPSSWRCRPQSDQARMPP